MTKVTLIKNELVLLGRNIRTARRDLEISQEELAGRSNVHRTYLSDVESGRRNPSFFSLLAIARGLGLTVSEVTRNLDPDISSSTPPAGEKG